MTELEEKIKQKEKEKWIRCWFAIEAMAVRKDVVETALDQHIEKLERIPSVFVYKKEFKEAKKVDNPPKDVEEAYSQVVELELFVKDLFSLINVIIVYGPSSIEILGPEKIDVGVEELQNLANLVAGLMHKFAAAGLGGMAISPGKKINTKL